MKSIWKSRFVSKKTKWDSFLIWNYDLNKFNKFKMQFKKENPKYLHLKERYVSKREIKKHAQSFTKKLYEYLESVLKVAENMKSIFLLALWEKKTLPVEDNWIYRVVVAFERVADWDERAGDPGLHPIGLNHRRFRYQ